jgi:hypothetical protein
MFLVMNDLPNNAAKRNPKRQRQARHLHDAGPRPVLEALLAVASGADLDDVLADFARIPVDFYHDLGANVLPVDRRLN